eukprot:762651-Hanusia_phi.AAC.1
MSFGNTGSSFSVTSSPQPRMSSAAAMAFGNTGASFTVPSSPQLATLSPAASAVAPRSVAPVDDVGDTVMGELITQLSDIALESENNEMRGILNDIIQIHTKLNQDMQTNIAFAKSFKTYIEADISGKQHHLLEVESLMTKVGQLLNCDLPKQRKSKLSATKKKVEDKVNLEFVLFRDNIVKKGYITNWFQGAQRNNESRFFLTCLFRRLEDGAHGPYSKDMLLEVIQYKPLFYTVAKVFIENNESTMQTLKSFQSKKAICDIKKCLEAEEENEKAVEEEGRDLTWTPSRPTTRSAEKVIVEEVN